MRVEINNGIKRELERDPGVANEMVAWAHRVANVAKFHAPFRTGHYARSLFVQRQGNGRAWVGFHDFKAWWIEYGAYGRTPPFPAKAPLRKALRNLNIRYVPTKHDSVGG